MLDKHGFAVSKIYFGSCITALKSFIMLLLQLKIFPRSKTLDRRIVNSRSTSALGEELSNGGPPALPRRVSMGAFLTRSSASFSVKSKPLMKTSANNIGLGKNTTCAGVSCLISFERFIQSVDWICFILYRIKFPIEIISPSFLCHERPWRLSHSAVGTFPRSSLMT